MIDANGICNPVNSAPARMFVDRADCVCPFQYNDDIRTRIVEAALVKEYGAEYAAYFETEKPIIRRYAEGVFIAVSPERTINGRTLQLYEGAYVVLVNPCTNQMVESFYRRSY